MDKMLFNFVFFYSACVLVFWSGFKSAHGFFFFILKTILQVVFVDNRSNISDHQIITVTMHYCMTAGMSYVALL